MNLFLHPKENRLRSVFRLSFFILGMVCVWVVAGFIQGSIRGFGPMWLMSSISYIIIALLSTGLVFVSGKWIDFRSFSEFGLIKSDIWKRELVEGIVITTLVVGFLFCVGLLIGAYEFSGWRPNVVSPGTWISSLLGYFIMMCCVAYYEELLFRGYLTLNLFEGLQKNALQFRLAAVGATCLVSAFFALVHANNPNSTWLGILNIILAGFMLGVPYLISGSLATPIGIHFAWNFFQGPILGLPVSGIIFPTSLINSDSIGPELISGGSFGLEGGILGTVALIAIITIVLTRYRSRYVITQVNPAILAQSIVRQQ